MKFKKSVAVLCLIVLFYVTLCGFAIDITDIEEEVVTNSYTPVTIYLDGILETSGYILSGETYMSVSEFCLLHNLEFSEFIEGEDGWYTATIDSVLLMASEEQEYMILGDRCFYTPNGMQCIDGEYFMPVIALSKIIGADVSWDTNTQSVDVDSTNSHEFRDGEHYYDSDELYWLAKIISAESRGQSLLGMIGVGNVVLNRVESDLFPSNVYDVIFDTKYGVQFSPVDNGSIYEDASEMAIIAAKLCLEGYEVVGDSLYFVNPELGVSDWFSNTRTFVATIEDHDFYA